MPRPARVAVETEREARRAVGILPEAIQVEYTTVPADLQRWVSLHAQADEAVRLAELDLESWENRRRLQVMADWRRENLGVDRDQRSKPPTEAVQDATVYGDQEYERLRRRVIALVREKGEVAAMVEGIRAKKEMLVSLGADLRQEREREPSIRDRRQDRRA